jgi:hypothetical protein
MLDNQSGAFVHVTPIWEFTESMNIKLMNSSPYYAQPNG